MNQRMVALAGASCLALGGASATAQEADYVTECQDLYTFLNQSQAYDLTAEPELAAILERNDARTCNRRLAVLERDARQVRQVAGQSDSDVTTESRSVQEEVQLQETVTVQGEVDVVAPVPNVQVRPEPADVQVRSEPPRVTVREGQPEIVVRERPATITVGMPTITVRQQAPEIIITMPPSDVDVAMAEPQVEVRQAPPQVSVAVPDPRVDLDLRAVPGKADTPVQTRITRERLAAQDEAGLQLVARGDEGADANVYVADAEPQVTVNGTDAEAQIDLQRPEPQVRFEGAEPTLETSGQPEIRFERVGEPDIQIRQAAAEAPQAVAGSGSTSAPQQSAAAAPAAANVTVGDLLGKSVMGADDEEVGSIDRVVEMNGQTYAIIEHGGFLGIRDTDIPVPVTELRMSGDDLRAGNLTAQRAEQMQANDISTGEELPSETTLRIATR